MSEQRAFERYMVSMPVRVENPSGKMEAICHDGSVGGVLLATGAQLEAGESVFVSLPDRDGQPQEPIFGRVVRIDEPSQPGGLRRVAIEFIRPVPELEALFRSTSSRPPPML